MPQITAGRTLLARAQTQREPRPAKLQPSVLWSVHGTRRCDGLCQENDGTGARDYNDGWTFGQTALATRAPSDVR